MRNRHSKKILFAASVMMFYSHRAQAIDNLVDCNSWVLRAGGDEASRRPLEPSQIHYEVYGEKNTEPLVLIHGVDSAIPTFANVIEELAAHYKVVVYDQRGHGQTEAVGRDYSSELLARDLAALLDHLGLKSVHLLGHSFGARTAMAFSDLYPDRVKSMIVEDMEFLAREVPSLEISAQRTALANQLASLPRHFKSKDDLIAALAPLYGRKQAESLAARRAKANSDGSYDLLFRPDVSVLYAYQANTEDFTAALSRSRYPLLVLAADPERGAGIGPEGLAQLQETRPDAHVVAIEGAGHVIHRTHPEEFVKQVLGFLGNVTKASSTKGSSMETISADQVQKSAVVMAAGLLPKGSALITSSGELAKTGITAIIHAATGSMSRGGVEFDPTLESIKLSVKNSLALARKHGHSRVAIPFIGGGIFLSRIGVSAEDLASALVHTALESSGGVGIRFVTFGDQDTALFKKAVDSVGRQKAFSGADVAVLNGSITDFRLHGASAIVNAANMEVTFGSGVSGIIARATGNPQKIDEEAHAQIRAWIGNGSL